MGARKQLPPAEAARLLRTCSREAPAGLSGQWTPKRVELAELERRLAPLVAPALARAGVSEARGVAGGRGSSLTLGTTPLSADTLGAHSLLAMGERFGDRTSRRPCGQQSFDEKI